MRTFANENQLRARDRVSAMTRAPSSANLRLPAAEFAFKGLAKGRRRLRRPACDASGRRRVSIDLGARSSMRAPQMLKGRVVFALGDYPVHLAEDVRFRAL